MDKSKAIASAGILVERTENSDLSLRVRMRRIIEQNLKESHRMDEEIRREGRKIIESALAR